MGRKKNTRKKVSVPRSLSAKAPKGGLLRMAITDILNTTLGTTSNAGADVVTTVPVLASSNLFSIKLGDYASAWLEYRIVSCVMRYVSVLTSTSYGLAAFGYQPDPYATAPATCFAIEQCADGDMISIYKNHKFRLSVSSAWMKVLYDGVDKRMSQLGQFSFGTTATSAAQFPGYMLMDLVFECRGQIG